MKKIQGLLRGFICFMTDMIKHNKVYNFSMNILRIWIKIIGFVIQI